MDLLQPPPPPPLFFSDSIIHDLPSSFFIVSCHHLLLPPLKSGDGMTTLFLSIYSASAQIFRSLMWTTRMRSPEKVDTHWCHGYIHVRNSFSKEHEEVVECNIFEFLNKLWIQLRTISQNDKEKRCELEENRRQIRGEHKLGSHNEIKGLLMSVAEMVTVSVSSTDFRNWRSCWESLGGRA